MLETQTQEAPKKGRGRPRTAPPKRTAREQMALDGTVYHCSLCGRPVRQLLRGNIKMKHYNCSMIDTLLTQLYERASNVKWQDESNCRAFAGRLFALKCSLFNSPKDKTFAPDSNEEF